MASTGGRNPHCICLMPGAPAPTAHLSRNAVSTTMSGSVAAAKLSHGGLSLLSCSIEGTSHNQGSITVVSAKPTWQQLTWQSRIFLEYSHSRHPAISQPTRHTPMALALVAHLSPVLLGGLHCLSRKQRCSVRLNTHYHDS